MIWQDYLSNHVQTFQLLNTPNLTKTAEHMAHLMIESLREGGKIIIAGNGGSAADAQHFAAELTGRFLRERQGLAGLALTTDTSALTAIGNDYGYEYVFSRQLEGLGKVGDIFVGISTSGNSPNILLALEKARQMGITTIGFTGKNGGQMPALCDQCFIVPSEITAHIQEAHIFLVHYCCAMIDEYFAL